MRKLADGNCWMTQDLRLVLTAGTAVTASRVNGSTFSWTPTSCSGNNGACAMNGNTILLNTNRYYNWYAATAGAGLNVGFDTDTTTSICPAKWRLPANYTKDKVKSYGNLTDAYDITVNGASSNVDSTAKLDAVPFNFYRVGYINSRTLVNNDNRGLYWSSTSSPNTQPSGYARYFIYLPTTGTHPQAADAAGFNGFTVRCVAL